QIGVALPDGCCHPGQGAVEYRFGALRGAVLRGNSGTSGGQYHPCAGVHGGGDRLGDSFGTVGDDLHRSDVISGLAQAARGLGSGTVLTFTASAPVGDRDHRYRHVLGHAPRVPMRGLSGPEMVTYTT